tara:strand:- start:1791 stop:2780 length:990 start_codon:yes stop_codon:yes gene_type:complete
MIQKSYIIEDNIKLLKNKFSLFYGENLGLINEFKSKISNNYNNKIIKFNQNDILENQSILLNEIENLSLFEDKKVFFLIDVNDKILNIIEEIISKNNEYKIYLFTEKLDKKSKLRNFFEKGKTTDVIPCYHDNEINLRKIVSNKLKDYSGLTIQIINFIIVSCSYERAKINNEVEKIKSYFINKQINSNDLLKILNIKEDYNFNLIKEAVLNGQKNITNRLLNSTAIENDKIFFYISSLNLRLMKLKEVKFKNYVNVEKSINELKPPIFWKDKPNFLNQLKIWSTQKIDKALKEIYNAEIIAKSKSNINKDTLIKKLVVDLCCLANASA